MTNQNKKTKSELQKIIENVSVAFGGGVLGGAVDLALGGEGQNGFLAGSLASFLTYQAKDYISRFGDYYSNKIVDLIKKYSN